MPWPPARGIQDVFGEHLDCYSFYDGPTASSIRESVKDLSNYIATEGPFDGVIGFSQGAVLAATLIIAVESGLLKAPTPFRFAIFLCGGLPFDFLALQAETMKFVDPDLVKVPLSNLPVANAWASNDIDYPGAGEPLSRLCVPEKSWNIVHDAGHGVPGEGADLDKLVNIVVVTMQNAK